MQGVWLALSISVAAVSASGSIDEVNLMSIHLFDISRGPFSASLCSLFLLVPVWLASHSAAMFLPLPRQAASHHTPTQSPDLRGLEYQTLKLRKGIMGHSLYFNCYSFLSSFDCADTLMLKCADTLSSKYWNSEIVLALYSST